MVCGVNDTILKHRSLRSYTGAPVTAAALERILNAARRAPSSINGQQWSVVVVEEAARRAALSECCGQPHVAEAAVVLVFVADFHRISQACERAGVAFENMPSVESTLVGAVDCGIAMSCAMLTAESLGYGTVPLGSVRREPQAVIDLLELPEGCFPIVGLAIGQPSEAAMAQAIKPRLPASVMVKRETYQPDPPEDIAAYDAEIAAHTEVRKDGGASSTWTARVANFYSRVYFPKVHAALAAQGFKNDR